MERREEYELDELINMMDEITGDDEIDLSVEEAETIEEAEAVEITDIIVPVVEKTKKESKFVKKFYSVLLVMLLIGAAYFSRINGAQSKIPDENVPMAGNTATKAEKKATEKKAKAVEETKTEEAVEETASESLIEIPDKELDWNALLEENPDVYAWIYIPGTQIDLPIVSSHGSMNTDYYLDHCFDGTKGYPGCLYSQHKYNTISFTDKNQIIYGHNMKDGSMFAGLHDYADAVFFEENPYIYIYTPTKQLAFQVFAAYKTGDYLIPETFDFNTDFGYAQYIEYVLGDYNKDMNSHYNLDAAPTSDDQIITLSTCIKGQDSKRWLVQGKLVE